LVLGKPKLNGHQLLERALAPLPISENALVGNSNTLSWMVLEQMIASSLSHILVLIWICDYAVTWRD